MPTRRGVQCRKQLVRDTLMSSGKHQQRRDSSRTGDIAEYYAVTWLWDSGYEVFKNCGCTGQVDLVAIKDNEIFKFDVKSSWLRSEKQYRYARRAQSLTKEQKENGIHLLIFNPETRKCQIVLTPKVFDARQHELFE